MKLYLNKLDTMYRFSDGGMRHPRKNEQYTKRNIL